MEDLGELQVETLQEPPKQASQPVAQEPPIAEVNPLKDLSPQLNDGDVRAAIANAEANGIDALSLKLSDLEAKEPAKTPAPQSETKPALEIPEKFKKPDGEVDVEKLKTSTRQLDEALQKKEEKLQKTVEEMYAEYKAKEKKLSSTPNAEKLAASAAAPVAPPPPVDLVQLKARILQDMQSDPVGAITELIDIISERKLEPVKSHMEQTAEERRDNAIRANIRALAEERCSRPSSDGIRRDQREVRSGSRPPKTKEPA